jgi:hypothetical protein
VKSEDGVSTARRFIKHVIAYSPVELTLKEAVKGIFLAVTDYLA